ncbi:GntR family transcriptional regulator [Tepidanaerobacter syntrophicus]|uniref:GntR family transcriptional regulator n=2 Tax=Tepidanaerobacteraceae TaxID=2770092 RepID=A0A0U9HGW2_9FIRM|nr:MULTISPECIES: GntR family transcriptional regulator [Tepidanaerobacter]GAQ25766.1 GntR family transcriptional regulator [Tepidanaerobacter syntrophicus]GLI20134.1 GntR family transcriptional regulator [Tepidanaerobacter syntrophicus]GLI50592.1 GntR family transcriptional regulator [Tepidanaerobacter syntrophicus]
MMGLPIYLQIVEDIKEKINSGELKPGDPIYSENTLCKNYNTSRMTVRKGLAILANEGYIYSIPGKGNFVQEPDSSIYTLYYDEMNNLINSVDKTKLLEVNIIMPPYKLIDSLQITKNKKVIMIRRLFYTDEEPVAYDVKYLPYYKGMPIVEKEIRYATFPEMVSKNTSLFAIRKELVISVQMPDEELSKYLNIYNAELPLMVIEQKLYDMDNKPMGLGITYFRGDYCKLYAEASFFKDKAVQENRNMMRQ